MRYTSVCIMVNIEQQMMSYIVVWSTIVDSPRVRLAGGQTIFEGVPELYYKGHWLPLCVGYGGFSEQDAAVICGHVLHTKQQ